ncbi:carbohydrate ABC transporter permease [Cohnella thailandensis]|uniref:Sugar ABC transporter permease n=1 Tax=Cohnella thailandensis TaxID=557557 RepID=A0A841SY66_9BACL|nr:sugar ABC transporter permease [Cohnella thailandensis]MBB6637173.1 sugar ABC transporter permease [Cohnella thailandensis]MBP1977007.1 ABC-type sugar transport system permease subunit [Cohnella thailandensis]
MLHRKMYPVWLIVPALAIYVIMYIFPTASGFYYSLTDWSPYKDSIGFVGFEQFAELFKTKAMYTAMKHTVIYAVIVTILQNGLGVLLALLLNSKLAGRNFFRSVYFLPCILSALVVGYTFTIVLHPDGIFNQFLSAIGLSELSKDWLGDPKLALYTVTLVNVWQWAGSSMALYLAGLQGISKDMLEAAVIDGTTYLQRLRYVMLPILAPVVTISVLLSMIGSMKTFELIYVTTGGGPGGATEVMNTFIVKQFGAGLYAYGTAANVVLFLSVAIVSIFLVKLMRKGETAE